jgi:hypothetical protein
LNFSLSNNTDSIIVSSVTLKLLEILAEYCPEDITNAAAPLSQFFAACFAYSETKPSTATAAAAAAGDPKATFMMRVACARAILACVVAFEGNPVQEAFKAAIQPVMTILGSILSEGRSFESDANRLMEYLCTIGTHHFIFS